MSDYVVRKPHQDRAGNHKRAGEPAGYDAELARRGLIATPAAISAEREERTRRAAKVTYEFHHYER
jgi:adenylylsulfate kinase-like enzyme